MPKAGQILFINGIAQKEVSETQYWLDLLFQTDYLTQQEYDSIIADSEEVIKLLRSSILTKKKNMNAGKDNKD